MALNTCKPNVALVITALALVFGLTSSYAPYQYLLFVQQWPKSVCYDINCPNTPTLIFTIHGLRPSNYNGPRLVCSGGVPFSETLMNQQTVLKANLEQHSWPDVEKGNHMGFWRHEWQAHGQCSDTIFPQTKYFQWCHDMWKKNVIGEILERSSIIPGLKKYSLSAIENAIRANTSHDPYIRCAQSSKDQSDLLKEVVICFDYYGNNVVDCKSKTTCPTGPDSILYPN